jgi:curved DNA-binding protein CbpA
MNPYKELNLLHDASQEEIKRSYRSLAQRHHPDKGGDAEIFKRIKHAYEILSDPVRKERFDLRGDDTQDVTVHSDALTLISEIMNDMMYRVNPYQENLIDFIKTRLNELNREADRNLQQAACNITHLQLLRDRIKADVEDNVLLGFLQVQLNIQENEHKKFNRQMSICDDAMTILFNYRYVYDPKKDA